MVGKQDGECLGLTDYHVTHGREGDKALVDMRVKMPNGKTYPAELRFENPGKDLSMIAVKTGADTDAACHPAVVAEDGSSLKTGELNLGVGYPFRSQTAYAHPGAVVETNPADKFSIDSVKDEDLKRPVVFEFANYQPGDSGGGVFDAKGKAVRLIDKAGLGLYGGVTPITRSEVQDMIKRSQH
jgi:S1-C subfamily serine protease